MTLPAGRTPVQMADMAGQTDVWTGAVRVAFGQQRRWRIPAGFALVLPECAIDSGATLVIEAGAELDLLG